MNFDWPSSPDSGRPAYVRVTIISAICFFSPLLLFFTLYGLAMAYRWGGEWGGLIIPSLPFAVLWPLAFCFAIAGLIKTITYLRNCHSRGFPIFCALTNGAILLVTGWSICVFSLGYIV